MTTILILVLLYLIRVVWNSISDKKIEDKRKVLYNTNDHIINDDIYSYHRRILGIENLKRITDTIVKKAYYDKLSGYAEERLSGVKVEVNLTKLRASKEFLEQCCHYHGTKN